MQAHFDADEYFCTNPYCLIGRWVVTLDSHQVWRVISEFDKFPFLVSGPSPVCPCCASQLLTPLEMEDGFADSTEQEQGPLFDFVRSLS